uniref:Uncharacterized protein n=1 Tax=Arundo donax TaxID=35708 RepID=A0A0A9DSA8_ARUDO
MFFCASSNRALGTLKSCRLTLKPSRSKNSINNGCSTLRNCRASPGPFSQRIEDSISENES